MQAFKRNTKFSIDLSKPVLFTGLVLGLGFSVIFYSFLFLTRDVMLLLSTTTDYDQWLLTGAERYFYNLFFAFISVIFGQSICFGFWISNSKTKLQNANRWSVAILHDQHYLNLNFINWFAKVSMLYALFIGLTAKGGYYVFSFFPDYAYVFVLIIVVLFLQTWTTIRLANKRRSLRWMAVSAAIITVVSFGLAQFKPFDYGQISQSYLSKDVFRKYNLKLPAAEYQFEFMKSWLLTDIYVVKPTDVATSDSALIILQNKKRNIDELALQIINPHEGLSIEEYIISHRIYDDIPRMIVDKGVSMHTIKTIEKQLQADGFKKVAYAVVPENASYNQRYYKNHILMKRLLTKAGEAHFDSNFNKNIHEIKLTASGNIFLNETLVAPKKLKKLILSKVPGNKQLNIKLDISDKACFSDYIKIRAVIASASSTVNDIAHQVNTKSHRNFPVYSANDISKGFRFYVFETIQD